MLPPPHTYGSPRYRNARSTTRLPVSVIPGNPSPKNGESSRANTISVARIFATYGLVWFS